MVTTMKALKTIMTISLSIKNIYYDDKHGDYTDDDEDNDDGYFEYPGYLLGTR